MTKKINIYQVAYKNLLRKKTRSALTVLLVTHNPALAKVAGRTITLRDGKIAPSA